MALFRWPKRAGRGSGDPHREVVAPVPPLPQSCGDSSQDGPAPSPPGEELDTRITAADVCGVGCLLSALLGVLFFVGVDQGWYFRARQINPARAEGFPLIDGAVQQYIFEYDLQSLQQFIDLHGTIVADWDDPNLIGEKGYLREQPVCPFGGTYYIVNYELNDQLAPVISLDAEGKRHLDNFWGYTDGLYIP